MNYPRLYKKEKSLSIGPFDGGIVIDVPRNEIRDSNSPDMLNMGFKNGIMKKREGQKVLFDNGEDNMNACFEEAFNGYIIYHAGERIKAYNLLSKETLIFNMYIPDKKGEFFTYNGKVYYTGFGEYYRITFSEDTLKLESIEGYAPLRYINCNPDTGIGDDNEKANLLTPRYRASYSAYKDMLFLTLPPYTSNENIIVEYNGNIVSSEKYSYSSGKLAFQGIGFEQGHNNVVITASDTRSAGDREKITNCTASISFGGSSSGFSEGTRLFLAGNPQYANTYFRSELKNPEYFPVDAYDILGDTLDPITGFGRQGGGLVIFKKNSIYFSNYVYSSGEVVFTITNISADKGCDFKNTIQSVDNRLIWFNSKYGVMALSSTSKNNEKNVCVISGNINGSASSKALLNKQSYEGIAGFIYKNKYHLCTKDYCYVFDYENSSSDFSNPQYLKWYLYSNVFCSFFVKYGNMLYLAGEKERFTYFSDCLYDFSPELPICSYFVTKAYDMGNSSVFKTVKDISLILRADNNAYAEIECMDEDGKIKEFEGYRISKFSFSDFKFSRFTFYDSSFAVFIRRKINRKRVKFFSVRLKNYEPLSDMAVSELTVTYQEERGAKYNGI